MLPSPRAPRARVGALQISDYAKLEAALLAVASPTPLASRTSSTSRTKSTSSSASAAFAAASQLGAALGSRAHLAAAATAQRALYRTILMKGMHLAVALLCATKVTSALEAPPPPPLLSFLPPLLFFSPTKKEKEKKSLFSLSVRKAFFFLSALGVAARPLSPSDFPQSSGASPQTPVAGLF